MRINRNQANQLIDHLEDSLAIVEKNAEHRKELFLTIYKNELQVMMESGMNFHTDCEIWRKIKDFAINAVKEKDQSCDDIRNMIGALEDKKAA